MCLQCNYCSCVEQRKALTPFEYVRGEEEKIKPTANPVIAYFSLIAIMKFVSIFSLCNMALKLKLDFLPCPLCISYKKIIQLRLIKKTSAETNP